jgi:hypothetical protein
MQRAVPDRLDEPPDSMASVARNAFQAAFEAIGGAEGLAEWARANRTQFYTMFLKLVPASAETGAPLAEVSEAPLSEREWSERAQDAA